MKWCPGCKEHKPHSDFGKNRAQWDGLKSYCKCCERAHRAANREHYREYNTRYARAYRARKRAERQDAA